MPTVIPVRFRYAARDLLFDPLKTGAQEGDHVICATERGREIGLATADAREVTAEELDELTNHATLKPIARIATDDDLDRADLLAERGDAAMATFRRLVAESGLDMKPVGVEYLFDGEKAVCYFAAEERVDFRQLVRDLSRELHGRIDMRQIGVREEAAIVGGYGHCGQELCCQRFGLSYDPVSIRMAKEQDLPLNSTKISGACGRLMCCLRYEFEAYRDFKGRAPKRNAVIDTPLGKGKIIEYDTPKEQICLRLENGKQVRVPLSDMTPSEAAIKKSEELGCPCRPDTVSREALDRLQSPDVQMALAELDRKTGVVKDVVDESDLFVKPARKRRRGSDSGNGNGNAGGQPNNGEKGAGSRGRGQQPAKPKARTQQPARDQQEGEAGTTTRRRRHKTRTVRSEDQVQNPQAQANEAPAQTDAPSRRRRHHRSSGEGVDAPAQQPQQQGQGSQGAQQPKRTRRPGDKGGMARQPQHMRDNDANGAPNPQNGQGGQPADGESKPKRRRHRGGRGRGKGNGGNGGNANGGQPGNGGAPASE